ncbi:MAG: penicillin-binding protein, partial [Mesorhizobium sp.]
AWFVGFTGNYTAAVWLGNDDFTPTNKMTGGSLPAMVWQRLMVYAHQNIDLKPIPGLDHPFVDPEVAAKAEEAAQKNAEEAAAQAQAERPPVLSGQTTQTLREMTKAFQTAPVLDAPKAPETLSAL